MARDYAGQNRRANERARAKGYKSKDDQYQRRRAGNPTPADIKAGSADWSRLPGGRIWLRIPFDSPKKHVKAEQLLAKLVPTLPAGSTVAITVRFDDGSYRQLTSGAGVPVSEMQFGITLLVAELLDGQVQGGNGTGAPKKTDTPLTAMKVEQIVSQLEADQDSSMFDLVQEVQLTIAPPAAGVTDDF